MKRYLLLVLVLVAAALIAWAIVKRSGPPRVPFAKVTRETLISILTTNGTVEPIQWVTVRAGQEGLIQKVNVSQGQRVSGGTPLAELDAADARAELAADEARLAQAQASLEIIERGGRSSELADINGQVERLKVDLDAAQKDYESLKRLAEKQAATGMQVAEARGKVQTLGIQIQTLEKRRAALVSGEDRKVAQANLRNTQVAVSLAREHVEQNIIRAPMAGVVYHLAAHVGNYLEVGDEVASIGELKQLRVTLNVDEPELGRVAKGMPVQLTWDALPGRVWKGVVDRAPTEIVPLGTRQVGKVICIIENPDMDLLPGTNVNAQIQSKVVPNAIAIPKEALRTEGTQTGVFLLQGNRAVWRNITVGISTVTKVQVTSGLSEGDSVALAGDVPLKDGSPVRAYYPGV